MPIDFHDAANRDMYSGRDADATWRAAATALVNPVDADVVDIGCGEGTYTRAWHELRAGTVTGVDISAPILASARAANGDLPGVAFRTGEASATGLTDGCADVVFERALVHHVRNLGPLAAEAARLLRPRGVLLIQDRTPEDVAQPGSVTHVRGLLFEAFPRLLEVENGRRPTDRAVSAALAGSGLVAVTTSSLWEIRRRYADREHYLQEIAQRTGRSILHELSDQELGHLVGELRERLPDGPLIEQDRWTIWRAEHA